MGKVEPLASRVTSGSTSETVATAVVELHTREPNWLKMTQLV